MKENFLMMLSDMITDRSKKKGREDDSFCSLPVEDYCAKRCESRTYHNLDKDRHLAATKTGLTPCML